MRQIVYDGTPGIFITYRQARFINLAHTTWVECQEIQDSLLIAIDSCQVAFSAYRAVITAKDSQLVLRNSAIRDRDTLISAQKDNIRIKDKRIHKLENWARGLGISTAVLGVVVILLILL